MSRDTCAAAHDWVGYWETFVQSAAGSLHRLKELKAPPSLIQQCEDNLARWIGNRELARASVWVASKQTLPTGYRYRPGCTCCLCQGVMN